MDESCINDFDLVFPLHCRITHEVWSKIRQPNFTFIEVGGNTMDVYEVVKNRHCDTLSSKIKYVTKEFVNKRLASPERTLVLDKTGTIVAQNYVL